VELRREQYTLRDQFSPVILTESTVMPFEACGNPEIDCEITVLPLGVNDGSLLRRQIFQKWENLIPSNFKEEELKEISDYYWEKKNYKMTTAACYIDFRDLEHVYEMF
jgi:hypothetical protein